MQNHCISLHDLPPDGREFAGHAGIDENTAVALFSALLGMKTSDVRTYIHTLHDELDTALGDVNSVMDLFTRTNVDDGKSRTSGAM
mgnify:CR=1 FL=1